MKKKRLSAIFMALALCVSLSAATACSASDNGEKPGSGIDAPGGNTDGTVSHNFIAIKNISENEIDLTGYTVSYSENGTDLAEKSLSGSIAAGEVYIIRCAAANTTSAVINVAETDDNSADFEAVSFKGEAQGSEKATTYMKKLGLE